MTTAISILALVVSIRTARVQIELHKQDWIPRLAFERIHIEQPIHIHTQNIVLVYFGLQLRNVGKCDIYYEIIEFDTWYGNQNYKRAPVPGGIGVNSSFIHKLHASIDELEYNDAVRIDFAINYWCSRDYRKDNAKRSLEYTICMHSKGNEQWEQIIENVCFDGIKLPISDSDLIHGRICP